MSSLEHEYDLLQKKKTPGFFIDNGEIISFNEYVHKILLNSNWSYNFAFIHVIPGSFNPLHKMHKKIYERTQKVLYFDNYKNNDLFFELSIKRLGKEVLSYHDLKKRVEQFSCHKVFVTNSPKMIQKIGILRPLVKNINFHIGIDTYERMLNDYGKFGIQGLHANFSVYTRIIDGKKKSILDHGDKKPFNCKHALAADNEEEMKISSTRIRGENGRSK